MPLAKSRTPDGQEFKFYAPRGLSPEALSVAAENAYYRMLEGIDVSQPPYVKSTMGGEFKRGLETALSSGTTAIEALFGDAEEAARKAAEREEDISARYGAGPKSLSELGDVADREGTLAAIGEGLGQVPEVIAGQGAQWLGTIAAGGLGTLLTGSPIGGVTAAGAVMLPQFAGANISRRAQAQQEAGQPIDIDVGKAFGTAALQTVPELAGQYFILGKGLVNKILRIEPEKLTTAAARKAAADKLLDTAQRGFLATTARGAGAGIVAEIPTEVSQQILERAQAGLDILSPEAIAEYGEAAFTAATVGGALGPIGSLGDRSAARSRVEALKAAGLEEPPTPGTALVPTPSTPPPEPEGIAGELVSPTPPPALAAPEVLRLPAPSTAINVGPEGTAFPASLQGIYDQAKAAEAESERAAIGATAEGAGTPANVVRKRQELEERRAATSLPPQRELFDTTEAPVPPAPPRTLTAEFLTSLGVPRASGLIRGTKDTPSIVGKNLTNPVQRNEVAAAITQYLKNPAVTAQGSNQGVNLARLLKSPVFADATTEPATEPAAQQQLTIDDQIAATQEREDLAAAAAQRRQEQATRKQQEDAAYQQREDEQIGQAVADRVAQRPAGVPPTVGRAMQQAESRGRRVPGQAQMEIPTIPPADPTIQGIAAEQRALEDEQPAPEYDAGPAPEQEEMFGPRGGRRRRNTAGKTSNKKPPPAEEPSGQAETVETETKEREMGPETSEAPAPGESDTDTDTTTGTADTDTGTVDEEAPASGETPRQKKAPVEPEAAEPVAETKNEREAARVRRERAQAKAQKNQAKAKQAESARKAAVAAEAAGRTQRTETANAKSKNDALFDIADELVNGTEAGKKAAQDQLDSLDDADYDNVAFYTNHMRFDEGIDLPASALARTAGAVDREVLELLKNNKLADALTQMAKMRNKSISRVATALARVAGNTKVRFEAGLKNDRGEIIAGKFEPKTNTVVLNSDFAPTNHVVLHEVMHAATAAELANPSSPYTKQLKNLFNTVKDRLDTAYGAESLDEFVAEAFSNPEFQAKLAQMDTKGDRISVWSRFKNIINNIVRKFRGLPSKEVNSVRDEMDKLVMEMLAPAPEFRGAADLHSATMSNIGEDMLNVIGKTAKGTVTKEDIAIFNDYMPGLRSETRKSILSVLPLNSIADYIAPQFPELSKEIKALFSLIQQKNGTRQNYLTKVRDTAKQLEKVFAKLPKELRELFNDIVMDSTMDRVDPSKPRSYYEGYRFSYVKADGTDFRSQSYKTADERNAAMNKVRAEDKTLQTRPYNPSKGVLEAYDKLQTKWRKMDKSAQGAYEALRDAYSEAFTDLRKTLLKRIDSIEANKDLKQTYKDKILYELLDKESIEPYFPLYRKGDYWLTYEAKDPDTGNLELYKEAFPTREERARARRELEQAKVQNIGEAARPDAAKRQRTGTVDPQFAYNLLGTVRKKAATYVAAAEKKVKDAGGGDAEVRIAGSAAAKGQAELEGVVLDALLDSMPERSLFRAFKRRKNILGAEHDALLVFRERMPAFMGQVSNLEFDAPFNKIKNNLTELANKKRGSADEEYAEEIANHAKAYADFARSPSLAPWARTVKSLGFAMTLGLNLSSAFVNLFTLPMAVYPYLSGKYGYGDTFKAMNRARKLYMSTGIRRKLNTFTGVEGGLEIDGPSFTNIDFSDPASVPESFKKLGDEELRRNKVLVDIMNQQGVANASTIADLLELNTATSSTTDKFNSVMGYVFHQGERLTRQITMKATYDLILNAKSKGGKKLTDEDYMAAAQEAILETEHTNSGSMLETAPKIAQNSLGSVLLMYKRFGISMMYMQFQMAKQALKDADPTVRKQAKKQLIGLFGMSGIFAGVQGLPLYGVVTTLANLFLLDDEDEDADSIAASFFGEGLYSGLLNEAIGWDIAPRIGMSNLIFRSLPNAEEESLTMQAIELAGGPIVGIAQRMLDSGLPLLMEGEIYRGMEKMTPSVVANIMKARRYGTEGVTTLRGDPITEDLGFGTLLGQTLGFAPTGYTKQLEINARDKRVDRVLNENRTKLLRQRYMAIRENDFDELLEIEEAIAEFSQRHPEIRITEDTKKKSLRQHKVTDEVTRMFNGVTISPQRRAVVMRRQLEDLDESEFFE
jgi:hypothetical protein